MFDFLTNSNPIPNKDRKDMKLKVIKERCPQNHMCPATRICPVGAIKQNGYDAPTIDEQLCTKCGKCVRVCPMGAFSLA